MRIKHNLFPFLISTLLSIRPEFRLNPNKMDTLKKQTNKKSKINNTYTHDGCPGSWRRSLHRDHADVNVRWGLKDTRVYCTSCADSAETAVKNAWSSIRVRVCTRVIVSVLPWLQDVAARKPARRRCASLLPPTASGCPLAWPGSPYHHQTSPTRLQEHAKVQIKSGEFSGRGLFFHSLYETE